MGIFIFHWLITVTPATQVFESRLAITLRWWDAAAVAPLLDGHTALAAFPDVLRRLHIVPLDDAAARRGLAGEAVLPVDRDFLQLTPTRRFLVGEVVAFEDTQRVWRYAVVKQDDRDRVDAIGTLQVPIPGRGKHAGSS